MNNSIHRLVTHLLKPVLALVAGFALNLGAQDAQLFVVKGQRFIQSGPGVPIFDSNAFPHNVFLRLDTPTNGIQSVSVRVPNGTILNLPGGDDGFEFEQDFAAKTGAGGLDASFGSGVYQFTITTDSGVLMPRVTLGPDAYPSTPTITSSILLQSVDASAPVIVAWNSFTGGTTNDFVQFQVRDTNDAELFITPGPGEPGALNGLSQSVQIPVGTLTGGRSYQASLLFANLLNVIEDAYGEAITAYAKETFLPFTTIAPPPPQGRFVFASPLFSESETQAQAAIIINRVGGTAGDVSVSFRTTGSRATPGLDYTETSLTVSFPDGTNSATVNVPLIDDALLEGQEAIRLNLDNPVGGAEIGGLNEVFLDIMDNETTSAGAFTFSVPLYRTTERSGKASIMIMRSTSVGQVNVDLSTMDASAVAPGDYGATNVTLVFSNGVRTRMLSIPIFNDALDETNETFQVKLNNPTDGASLGARSVAGVSIMDDDTAGSFSFSTAAFSVSETGSVANVIVRRTGGKSLASVDFAAIADMATSPDDFVATNLNLVFAANELQRVIPITLSPDTFPEATEQFLLTLRNPGGGAKLGTISNSVVRIIDDESSVSFTNATYTVSEAGKAISLNVVRSGALGTAVTVEVMTLDGSAQSPGDYRGTNFTLNLPANAAFRTIVIPIINDSAIESLEDFTVTLSNPQGGVQLGARTTATVNITDDELPGVIEFRAATYITTETAGTATITLSRSGGTAAGVTVIFQTTNGSATAGSDYTAVSNVVTFGANETSKTLTVPILTDAATEVAETVMLFLSDPTQGATLGARSSAVLTINNSASGTPGGSGFFFTATTSPGGAFKSDLVLPEVLTGVFGYTGGVLTIGALDPTTSLSAPTRTISLAGSIPANPILPFVITLASGDTSGHYQEQTINLNDPANPKVKQWGTTATTTGTLTITEFDPVNKIIAGMGSFSGTPDDINTTNLATGTATVTNIRFRFKYN